MRFKSAVLLGPHDPGINKLIEHAEYVAAIPWVLLRERGIVNERALAERVTTAMREGLCAMRPIEKGLARKIDVSAHLAELCANEGHEAVTRAGYAGSFGTVRFVTKISPNGTCKPSEVISALFVGDDIEARFVRTRLGKREDSGEWLEPMDIERFRRPPSARSTACEYTTHAQSEMATCASIVATSAE